MAIEKDGLSIVKAASVLGDSRLRPKIWLFRFTPDISAGSEWYEIQTKKDDIVEQLRQRNLMHKFDAPFEIWQIDFEKSECVEVSNEFLALATTIDISAEEANDAKAD